MMELWYMEDEEAKVTIMGFNDWVCSKLLGRDVY